MIYLRQREQIGKGRSVLCIFEKWQGGQCAWNRPRQGKIGGQGGQGSKGRQAGSS